MKRDTRGQVTVEVAVLFSFIIAAFVFMGVYLQRGAQGGMKGNVDSLGQQFSTASQFSTVSESQSFSTNVGTSTSQCARFEHELAELNAGVFAPAGNYQGVDDCDTEHPSVNPSLESGIQL